MGHPSVGHGPVAPGRGAIPATRFAGVPASSRVIANGGRLSVNRRTVFFNAHRCLGGFPCRNRFLFNSGFGLAYPYGYLPGFYPSDYSQEAQGQQPIVMSNGNEEGNTQLAVEIQRLSDEIEFMRQGRGRQEQAGQPGASLSARTAASTVFVFRDGRRMTTENYAIAGQTLWVFNEHAAKKYPLADLDRGATEQANADNGVDLRLPDSTP